MIINGEMNETDVRVLNGDENNGDVLKRSAIDSFIMSVNR